MISKWRPCGEACFSVGTCEVCGEVWTKFRAMCLRMLQRSGIDPNCKPRMSASSASDENVEWTRRMDSGDDNDGKIKVIVTPPRKCAAAKDFSRTKRFLIRHARPSGKSKGWAAGGDRLYQRKGARPHTDSALDFESETSATHSDGEFQDENECLQLEKVITTNIEASGKHFRHAEPSEMSKDAESQLEASPSNSDDRDNSDDDEVLNALGIRPRIKALLRTMDTCLGPMSGVTSRTETVSCIQLETMTSNLLVDVPLYVRSESSDDDRRLITFTDKWGNRLHSTSGDHSIFENELVRPARNFENLAITAEQDMLKLRSSIKDMTFMDNQLQDSNLNDLRYVRNIADQTLVDRFALSSRFSDVYRRASVIVDDELLRETMSKSIDEYQVEQIWRRKVRMSRYCYNCFSEQKFGTSTSLTTSSILNKKISTDTDTEQWHSGQSLGVRPIIEARVPGHVERPLHERYQPTSPENTNNNTGNTSEELMNLG